MESSAQVKVGDEFGLVRTCDAYRPVYYAAASGDFNPIHIDPEVGRQAGLGGVILHGLCTMAWVSEAAVAYFGGPERIRRLRVRFSRPVQVGDVIRLKGRVTRLEGGVATAEVTAVNQRGEDVVRGGLVEARVG